MAGTSRFFPPRDGLVHAPGSNRGSLVLQTVGGPKRGKIAAGFGISSAACVSLAAEHATAGIRNLLQRTGSVGVFGHSGPGFQERTRTRTAGNDRGAGGMSGGSDLSG